ncbi:MAG: hypothetical protein V3U93_07165 [Alphaproteobacteria bacterium]
MSRATLLFFSRDPGPTNVLIAVYEALSDPAILAGSSAEFRRFAVEVAQGEAPKFAIYGKDHALEPWRFGGHAARDWIEAVPAASSTVERDAALEELLRGQGVSAIITGTSDVDEDTDRDLWRAARALGLPSHVFLDHRSNLDRRFTDHDGTRAYPDAVYVPDEGYRDAIIADGISAQRVRVVGDLQLKRTRRVGQLVKADEIAALRARWSADLGCEVVLFASECTAEMAALGRPSPYSEFETLERLITDIRTHKPIGGRQFSPDRSVLVIRPHPRDSKGKYDAYAASGSPRVVVSRDGTPERAILAADIVVGMDSTLLFQAEVLDRTAVSLVPSSSFAQHCRAKEGRGQGSRE